MVNENTVQKMKQMLELLPENQLNALQAVTTSYIWDSPFRPKTEAEMTEKIDSSLAQADAGILQDADEAIDEVLRELELI